ncbi:MAG: RnfABCDGE type electron transport complex subunit G [Odoribacteraceae bacterium]|jgi:electron transport complex protein RnfG|nr:RnfABCDGE type electron transport complex subunit G [Odoribacteraceae bacterium]
MKKRLDSNFKNMVLASCVITLFSALSVAGINALTAERLDKVRLQNQLAAIRDVLPPFDNNPMEECDTLRTANEEVLVLFPASLEGERVGTAVKTFSNEGYSGRILLMVGFTTDGAIYNYTVLEHKETPGLGSKMNVWFAGGNKGDVTGKIPGSKGLRVSKDGGEIDAITAATVSSRAFLSAVNRASRALNGNVDATSGATGIETDAASGATSVEEEAASSATSVETDATSGATSVKTEAAPDTTKVATDATSGATSVEKSLPVKR